MYVVASSFLAPLGTKLLFIIPARGLTCARCASVYAFSALRCEMISGFLRSSSRSQKRSSLRSMGGSIGLGPRFSPSTFPNNTLWGFRFAAREGTHAAPDHHPHFAHSFNQHTQTHSCAWLRTCTVSLAHSLNRETAVAVRSRRRMGETKRANPLLVIFWRVR